LKRTVKTNGRKLEEREHRPYVLMETVKKDERERKGGIFGGG